MTGVANRALWYWHRLRNMPLAEIAHRVSEAWKLRTYKPPVSTVELKQRSDRSRQLLNIVALGSFRALERQDEICQQLEDSHVEVFGVRHDFSAPWRRDPLSGELWPSVPVSRMNHRSLGMDPKWTWEVHRLLYLVAPLLRVERDNDHVAATQCYRILRGWLGTTRPGVGIEWSSAIEVAIRSLVLNWLLQAGKIDDHALLMLTRKSLAEHANWLRRFPSRFSSANNHRVAELAALLVIDTEWTGVLDHSERDALQRELVEVTVNLFSSDGIGLEQSPTYAGFTIELAAIASRCVDWTDPHQKQLLHDTLAVSVEALREFTDVSGKLVGYGDDDEGKVLSWLVPDEEYVDLLEELVEVEPGVRNYGLTTFAAGGHSIMRYDDAADSETMVTFDHAPLGFGDIAAHGHADVLSFTLQVDGVRWIVDPGTFRYHGDHEWRNYFRSTKVHNAPALDGADSSTMVGDFNWSKNHRARPLLERCQSDGDLASVAAQHDGYVMTHGTRVRREIARIGKGRYRVEDTLLDASASLTVSLAIPPERDVSWADGAWTLRDTAAGMQISIRPAANATTSTVAPREESVWLSERFGEKRAAWGLVAVNSLSIGESCVMDIHIEKTTPEVVA